MEPYVVKTNDDRTEKANMEKDSFSKKPAVNITPPAGFRTDANKAVVIGAF